jgi:HEAT repeat protein
MRRTTFVIALLVCAVPLSAQQNNTGVVSLDSPNTVPRLARGTLTQRALNGSLAATMEEIARNSDQPVWAGYAVQAVSNQSFNCCSQQSECGLENNGDRYFDTGTVFRPPALDIFVFVRFQRGQVTRVRFFSSDCAIDARETSIQWLTGVPATQSVSYLMSVASNSAIAAIAFHADDSAVEGLIRMAHDAPSPGVRGQALFWMAQRAGAKMTAEITASIENDPDTEVKKRAVFALSLMPNGEGISKLIDVARTNRNPAVRKQAVFWLGQSQDARALKFLEDILTR